MRRAGEISRRGTSRASALTPKVIFGSSLALWLRADSGITIGTGVSAWADLSGNARHALQATGGNQPAYSASGLNGKPAVVFDNADDELANLSSWLADGSAYTVYMVGKCTVDPDSLNSQTMFRIQSSGGTQSVLQMRFSAGVYGVQTDGVAVAVNLSPGPFGVGTNSWYAVWGSDGSGGGANFTSRIKGVAKTTSGDASNISNINGYKIERHTNGWSCGEVIAVNALASGAQHSAAENYIRSFWGAFP